MVPIGKGFPTVPVVPSGRAAPTVTAPEAGAEKTSLTSITDLQNARWLQRDHPDAAGKLARLPWITDGVDPTEEGILVLQRRL